MAEYVKAAAVQPGSRVHVGGSAYWVRDVAIGEATVALLTEYRAAASDLCLRDAIHELPADAEVLVIEEAS